MPASHVTTVPTRWNDHIIIASGEIRPTVGIFVNPGIPSDLDTEADGAAMIANAQRSLEYDSMTPDYGVFI